MAPMSQDRPLSLAELRAKKAPPKIVTKTVTVAKKLPPTPKASATPPNLPPPRKSVANGTIQKSSTPRSSLTPGPSTSRQASREPLERLKQERKIRSKRLSPAISTPTFTSSDEGSADEQPKKRPRLERQDSVDLKRKVQDTQSFIKNSGATLDLVHAEMIAHNGLIEQSRTKYEPFFTALQGDEPECPTIEFQYPSVSIRERYQLVRPTDPTDFKPLDEIAENMRIVAQFYLDEKSQEKVDAEEDGSGYVQQLRRQAMLGLKSRVGAQSKFIDVVEAYNSLIFEKSHDGTITDSLDKMSRVDVKLVEHIIKNQMYARTVSPQVHLVRHYESFSDNVYGELLPKFLSRIFKETHLKSDQVFVDLGSGVGNCVLQAALEIGCESWGCEVMDNPNTLAQLQAKEFPARCHLWGIKPGEVRLIHGDFLKNEDILRVLKRADVVLVNNQAFTAELNDKLKYVFLDLKEGCQIVSLKPFRSPHHKIKDSNINDPINKIRVVEKERWSGMVSWSDDPGKWYHQKKDSSELDAFVRKMSGKK